MFFDKLSASVFLSVSAFISPTIGYAENPNVYLVESDDGYHKVCFSNTLGPGPTTVEYTFEVDEMELVATYTGKPFYEPDLLTISKIPPHLDYDFREILVEENETGCITIFPKLLG
jgi:hypothetical protein